MSDEKDDGLRSSKDQFEGCYNPDDWAHAMAYAESGDAEGLQDYRRGAVVALAQMFGSVRRSGSDPHVTSPDGSTPYLRVYSGAARGHAMVMVNDVPYYRELAKPEGVTAFCPGCHKRWGECVCSTLNKSDACPEDGMMKASDDWSRRYRNARERLCGCSCALCDEPPFEHGCGERECNGPRRWDAAAPNRCAVPQGQTHPTCSDCFGAGVNAARSAVYNYAGPTSPWHQDLMRRIDSVLDTGWDDGHPKGFGETTPCASVTTDDPGCFVIDLPGGGEGPAECGDAPSDQPSQPITSATPAGAPKAGTLPGRATSEARPLLTPACRAMYTTAVGNLFRCTEQEHASGDHRNDEYHMSWSFDDDGPGCRPEHRRSGLRAGEAPPDLVAAARAMWNLMVDVNGEVHNPTYLAFRDALVAAERRSEAARPVIPHFEPQRRPTRADQEPCTAEARLTFDDAINVVEEKYAEYDKAEMFSGARACEAVIVALKAARIRERGPSEASKSPSQEAAQGGANMRAAGEKPDPEGPAGGMAGGRSNEPNHEGAARAGQVATAAAGAGSSYEPDEYAKEVIRQRAARNASLTCPENGGGPHVPDDEAAAHCNGCGAWLGDGVRALCTKAPPGWSCSRDENHNGPCAASPSVTPSSCVASAMPSLADFADLRAVVAAARKVMVLEWGDPAKGCHDVTDLTGSWLELREALRALDAAAQFTSLAPVKP